MMKKMIAIVLCAVTALSLVACGGTKVKNDEQCINGVKIPNPFVEYSSIEEAEKVLGFDVNMISNIPDGYEQDSIFVIDKEKLVEVNFKKVKNKICYRIAKDSSDDISGDYNEYSEINTVKINDTEVVMKGNKGNINVVIWTKDGLTYSLCVNGFEKTVVTEMISGIL